MSRYTPPKSAHHELTSDRFKGRPAWVRWGAWACVLAVIAMAMSTLLTLFL